MDPFFQPTKRLLFLLTCLTGTLLLLLSACASPAGSTSNHTPSPTATATVPLEGDPPPTGPYQLTAWDSGKMVTLGVGGRMTIRLYEQQYPQAQLRVSCSPPGVLRTIAPIPPEAPPVFYAASYEAVQPGACTIKDGTFLLTVRVYYIF